MKKVTLKRLEILLTVVALLTCLTLYGHARKRALAAQEDAVTMGRFSRAQIEQHAALICRTIVGEQEDVVVSAMPEPFFGPSHGGRPTWAVECAGSDDTRLASLVIDAETGALRFAARHFLPGVADAHSQVGGREAATRVARTWLARLDNRSGIWRLIDCRSPLERPERQWICRFRSAAERADIAVRDADGGLVWIDLTGAR